MTTTTPRQTQALISAIESGDLDVVTECVSSLGISAADIETIYVNERAVFHWVCENGNQNMAEWFVDFCGPQIVDRVSSEGRTAMHFAACNENVNIMRFLVGNFGMNVEAVSDDGDTPLHCAIQYERHDTVEYLIEECHVDVNATDAEGMTVLHWAVYNDRVDDVEYLVDKTDVNIRDMKGRTAFHYACLFGNLEIVQLLVGLDVDTSIRDNDGYTALHLGVNEKQCKVVAYLLDQAKVDAHLSNDIVESPFAMACRTNNIAIVLIMVQHLAL